MRENIEVNETLEYHYYSGMKCEKLIAQLATMLHVANVAIKSLRGLGSKRIIQNGRRLQRHEYVS